jgi:hypothetical protein
MHMNKQRLSREPRFAGIAHLVAGPSEINGLVELADELCRLSRTKML